MKTEKLSCLSQRLMMLIRNTVLRANLQRNRFSVYVKPTLLILSQFLNNIFRFLRKCLNCLYSHIMIQNTEEIIRGYNKYQFRLS